MVYECLIVCMLSIHSDVRRSIPKIADVYVSVILSTKLQFKLYVPAITVK